MDVSGIEQKLKEKRSSVEVWIKRHAEKVCFPIYSSVDLRDAGFKISAIDANIFPAGFNNLCRSFLEKGATLFREYVKQNFGDIERVAIYPESHTRNKFYLQNLHSLKFLVEQSGFQAIIATADPRFSPPVTELETVEGQKIHIHRLFREANALVSEGFIPELILINNDFSDGKPQELVDLDQPVSPPAEMGWFIRSKWEHTQFYMSLVQEFADILSVDPWLLSPVTEFESNILFKTGEGLDRVAKKVDHVREAVVAKYREYEIDREPVIFIKDNAGTYGMGIITVASGEQVLSLNRNQRKKMSRGKSGADIRSVIIQEGIPTSDYFIGQPGEPVVHMIGDQVLGGFFRYSESKSEIDNLNSPGTKFAKLCLREADEFDEALACYRGHCSFDLYYTIARISCLAMGHEMKSLELCPEVLQDKEN
ncbi:MAG: glutamate--cysteine ligase [Candidatus Abyssobacteria bacterium SURF_5]|uniref:Glutamate--cysteine ligase n=1 Tax=Abyssobacteria bacterium (strain SURF_5) TaxID=2093360 RepID=A0A3A4P6P7_ABYX5|nr:MAG: glutamate--cysteine ligase [Candidatus Abyssubacteria bacterium SURF_5]